MTDKSTVKIYDMPDGSVVFLNLLPSIVKHPDTGQTWSADLIGSAAENREVSKTGKRRQ